MILPANSTTQTHHHSLLGYVLQRAASEIPTTRNWAHYWYNSSKRREVRYTRSVFFEARGCTTSDAMEAVAAHKLSARRGGGGEL